MRAMVSLASDGGVGVWLRVAVLEPIEFPQSYLTSVELGTQSLMHISMYGFRQNGQRMFFLKVWQLPSAGLHSFFSPFHMYVW